MKTEPDFNKTNRLVPAIAQDAQTGEVPMFAWKNRKAWKSACHTGRSSLFSMKRYKTPEQGSYRRRKPRNDPDRMNKFTARKFAFVATFLGSACGTLLVANPLYSSHFAGE